MKVISNTGSSAINSTEERIPASTPKSNKKSIGFKIVLSEKFTQLSQEHAVPINYTVYKQIKSVVGKDLYTYLKEIESFVAGNTLLMNGNGKDYHVLDDSPLAVAFWLIASLVSKPHQGTCVNYSLKTFSKYGELVECANRFDKLSSIIK